MGFFVALWVEVFETFTTTMVDYFRETHEYLGIDYANVWACVNTPSHGDKSNNE